MTLLVGWVGGEDVPLIRGVMVKRNIRIGLIFTIILIAKKNRKKGM